MLQREGLEEWGGISNSSREVGVEKKGGERPKRRRQDG